MTVSYAIRLLSSHCAFDSQSHHYQVTTLGRRLKVSTFIIPPLTLNDQQRSVYNSKLHTDQQWH